jgi:hypothetical protein
MADIAENLKTITAIAAVILSALSFYIARLADKRAKKAELIKNLLGEKENVGFGALKLLRDGLPKEKKDRDLIISALMQACLFEGSDRARALLYRVIEKHKMEYLTELQIALTTISENFSSMDKYKFSTEELDLARGRKRLAVVEKVVNLK